MTRIIAGAARGRRLTVAPGRGTRPTSDRAREGVFSTLESLLGTNSGAAVLDLYAGSGAVGLEALSRGADQVLLVESDPRAVRTVKANIDAVGLPGAAVRPGPVERVVAGPLAGAGPYSVAYVDPPYDLAAERLASVLTTLLEHGWLMPGAVVAVERATRDAAWAWPAGYAEVRSRSYGEATVWYGRAAESPASRGAWGAPREE